MLLARVRHPNIITVQNDRHDGIVGLWIEFVDGLTLARVLATRGALDPREAALVGMDSCAPSPPCTTGLVHRDIEAHNVMREGNGRHGLMDFGGPALRAPGRFRPTPRRNTLSHPEFVQWQSRDDCQRRVPRWACYIHVVTKRYPVEGGSLEPLQPRRRTRAIRSR